MQTNRTRVHIGVLFSVILVLLLAACGSAPSAIGSHNTPANPESAPNGVPSGYGKFMVFMGNGEFDPKGMNDMMMSVMSGAEFFSHMGWNDAQIAQHKAEALAFFKLRYGLDFSKTA